MLISFSLDNLRLPEYSGQEFDAAETVDLRELPPGLPVVEISIGRRFYREPGASEPDYREEVAVEKILPRDGEPKVCVRVTVISDPRQSDQPTQA